MRRPRDDGADLGEDRGAAFVRAVYAEHAHALIGYVTRMTGDRAKAEDIVQETVLRAWKHVDQLGDSDRPLRPWLFTVANRLVVDGYRAARVRPAEVRTDLLDHDGPLAALAGSGEELDRALEEWEVAEALGTLSVPHRQAIVETFYRGRSVTEAAVVLGVPPGTVKSRLFYGLRALRLALEERGWTP
ncbi:sigma-70 family RNA polymerase sigma factor [Spongisporangium articulatum]|uniref:RNA polymerase sigma factor n=1 Tax=Spongisporangium articulatum TaxID=3362603 RepID=A0ABW8AJG8_9ACTN